MIVALGSGPTKSGEEDTFYVGETGEDIIGLIQTAWERDCRSI